jgi:hypothetical protein
MTRQIQGGPIIGATVLPIAGDWVTNGGQVGSQLVGPAGAGPQAQAGKMISLLQAAEIGAGDSPGWIRPDVATTHVTTLYFA